MNETWWIGEDQLDDDQKAIVAIEPKGNHIIIGPPGSGKTNILLLHAKTMILSGQPNVLALVFTRTLQEFVTLGGIEYQLPPATLKTMMRWQLDFLYEHGNFANPDGSFDEKRLQRSASVSEVVAQKKLKGIYEGLFLDEAQDYLPQEIEILRLLGKNTFAAFDSRQKIYATSDCYKALCKNAKEHHLRLHYRIGKNICRIADAIMANSEPESLLQSSRYDEVARPSSADLIRGEDLNVQIERMIGKLEIQVAAYPNEMIGVICPKNETLEQAWEAIQQSPVADLALKQVANERLPFEHDKPICVCTIHSAKGLEFRALHVLNCEDLSKWPNHRNLTYTAVTRAKTSLTMYHSAAIQGYLTQAFMELAPKPKRPDLAELFKKGNK